jgi:hypothetical protein
MTWQDYERYIFQHFTRLYPKANISHNVKKAGLISKANRQIDILIETKLAGYDLNIIVDCKYFNKKIDVKIVESFIGFLHDVKANKGVLITNNGFSKAAKSRAENDSHLDLSIEIIEFNRLSEFQGFGGIAFKEDVGVVFVQPPGWIVDCKTRNPHVMATLYPIGLTFEDALESEEYIHIYITKRTENHPDLRSLFDFQEVYMRQSSENLEIEYHRKNARNDFESFLRITKYSDFAIIDYSWFVDFPDFYFYCTLLTPPQSAKKNLRRLEKIIKEAMPINVLSAEAGDFQEQ